MANQRKKGKKKIAFWLTDAEVSVLKEEAERLGLNMHDVMRQIIVGVAKNNGIYVK